MCIFHKETLASNGIFKGLTDYHSHILPGVDDGIRKMEDALDVLKYYESLGFSSVWCTPHIMEDIPNKTEDLRRRFQDLKDAYDGPVELHLAAENMLDNLFENRLSKRDLLPLGEEGSFLLVETSYFTPPFNMDEMLESILSAGFFPVLAHPERYFYMSRKEYEKYHSMGIRFQLNLPALTDSYGKPVQKKAEWLLKHGMYSFYGTDIHSLSSFKERIQKKINVKIPTHNEDQE